jgi:large subunit ribosomal protein L18
MKLKQKRVQRIRNKSKAVTSRTHRLSVHRSGKHIYAQVIDQKDAKVVASTSSLKLKGKKIDQAIKVGEDIATMTKTKKINTVYFDRGGYRYHGRIRALAESARKTGLKF